MTDRTRDGGAQGGGKGGQGGKAGGKGQQGQGGKGQQAQQGQGGKAGGKGQQGQGGKAGGKGQQGQGGKRGARDRLAAERKQQAKADSRKRTGSNIAIAVVVALVAGLIIGYAWWASQDEGPTDAALPALVSEPGGGVVIGDGPVSLDLWEDFQCPGCQQFEAQNAGIINERVDAGDVTVTLHPLSFLDGNVGNTSSVAAANALGCAADAGETQALDFHEIVYVNQPPETQGQEAWSTEDLIGWGNDVGIEGEEWETCVTDQTYAGWVEQVAKSQAAANISTTPTVFIDDEPFELGSDLDAAIDAALKNAQ